MEYFERNLRSEVNKQKGTEGRISRTIGVATTGTPVDTLRAFWFSFVGSFSHIKFIVKYGGYLQFKLEEGGQRLIREIVYTVFLPEVPSPSE